jgi:carbon monoxide dehydrogenase subunit G
VIETEQTVVIGAPISAVWDHARDIGGWASLMPGLQDCAVIDDDDSRWTLKVGVGALVRTVKVFVHVNRWAGPGEVDFTYSLEGDPVNGGGVYRARSLGPSETEMTIGVRVVGEGPMAPMWEAMGKPLLPRFARAFADQFKAEVEAASPSIASPEQPKMPGISSRPIRPLSFVGRLTEWLRRMVHGTAAPSSSSRTPS